MNCRVAFNGTEWIIYLDREGVEFLHECLLWEAEETRGIETHDEHYTKIILPILRIREAYDQ
jgi:hypothetical protein